MCAHSVECDLLGTTPKAICLQVGPSVATQYTLLPPWDSSPRRLNTQSPRRSTVGEP